MTLKEDEQWGEQGSVPTFTELQQVVILNNLIQLFEAFFLIVLPLLVPTYTVIVRFRTSRRNACFETTWMHGFSRRTPVVRCITAELLVAPVFRCCLSLIVIMQHQPKPNGPTLGLLRHFFSSFSY